jgi:hypothetical protein
MLPKQEQLDIVLKALFLIDKKNYDKMLDMYRKKTCKTLELCEDEFLADSVGICNMFNSLNVRDPGSVNKLKEKFLDLIQKFAADTSIIGIIDDGLMGILQERVKSAVLQGVETLPLEISRVLKSYTEAKIQLIQFVNINALKALALIAVVSIGSLLKKVINDSKTDKDSLESEAEAELKRYEEINGQIDELNRAIPIWQSHRKELKKPSAELQISAKAIKSNLYEGLRRFMIHHEDVDLTNNYQLLRLEYNTFQENTESIKKKVEELNIKISKQPSSKQQETRKKIEESLGVKFLNEKSTPSLLDFILSPFTNKSRQSEGMLKWESFLPVELVKINDVQRALQIEIPSLKDDMGFPKAQDGDSKTLKDQIHEQNCEKYNEFCQNPLPIVKTNPVIQNSFFKDGLCQPVVSLLKKIKKLNLDVSINSGDTHVIIKNSQEAIKNIADLESKKKKLKPKLEKLKDFNDSQQEKLNELIKKKESFESSTLKLVEVMNKKEIEDVCKNLRRAVDVKKRELMVTATDREIEEEKEKSNYQKATADDFKKMFSKGKYSTGIDESLILELKDVMINYDSANNLFIKKRQSERNQKLVEMIELQQERNQFMSENLATLGNLSKFLK